MVLHARTPANVPQHENLDTCLGARLILPARSWTGIILRWEQQNQQCQRTGQAEGDRYEGIDHGKGNFISIEILSSPLNVLISQSIVDCRLSIYRD